MCCQLWKHWWPLSPLLVAIQKTQKWQHHIYQPGGQGALTLCRVVWEAWRPLPFHAHIYLPWLHGKHICSAAGTWVQMPRLLHCVWVRQHSQMYLYRVCVQHLSPLSPKMISWVTKMTLKLDPEESMRLFANSGSRCDVKHGSINSCCSRGVDCALGTVMRWEAASVAPAPRLLSACSGEGVQRNPALAIGSCYLLWDK